MSHPNKRCDHGPPATVFFWYIAMASFVGTVTNNVYGALVGAVIGLIVGWLVEKKIV